MENSILNFCNTLASFCNHVESTTHSLCDSVSRRPIPLDSAASSFLNSLDRRISSSAIDLNLLDSLTLGTISFEELIGHCKEVYKTNDKYINEIEAKMISFGYVPEVEVVEEDELEFTSPEIGSKRLDFDCGSVSGWRSNRKKIEDGLLFDDSFSLLNLGLSDAGLATLALQDDHHPVGMPITLASNSALSNDDAQPNNSTASAQPPIDDMTASDNDDPSSVSIASEDISHDVSRPCKSEALFQPQIVDSTSSGGSAFKSCATINITEDEYDSLPPYIKRMTPFEELQKAVVKLNDCLCKKESASGKTTINQHDLEVLDLGSKGRSYLLMLLRAKKLVVETIDGSIEYIPIDV